MVCSVGGVLEAHIHYLYLLFFFFIIFFVIFFVIFLFLFLFLLRFLLLFLFFLLFNLFLFFLFAVQYNVRLSNITNILAVTGQGGC